MRCMDRTTSIRVVARAVFFLVVFLGGWVGCWLFKRHVRVAVDTPTEPYALLTEKAIDTSAFWLKLALAVVVVLSFAVVVSLAPEPSRIIELSMAYLQYWRRIITFTDYSDDTTALCVDCRHPTAPNLTHHRGSNTPAGLRADTSTEIVVLAVSTKHTILRQSTQVTCNHFDADGLCAVWAAVESQRALSARDLLVECARLGDFRELDLSSPTGRGALVFNVWLNAAESKHFWRPFHEKCEKGKNSKKFRWFLPRCGAALEAAARYGGATDDEAASAALAALRLDAPSQFDAEFNRVLRDASDLAESPYGGPRRWDALGLVVLHPPQPLHYYALFGQTAGYDVVATIYPGRRYGA